ncbi:probable serine/threonine-protein kinase PIX13 [Carya illinoinensis]|uniref:probable serine/threonine-protein kinase PIX13 n=1 Tax=Carya illinoinensis TaxID=32201 RepID=UPI001C72818D|nr:probable serine/threonine-protein kinase PIX13 [Carya illinoinensis]
MGCVYLTSSSENIGSSAASSSTGKGQFSEGESGSIDESYPNGQVLGIPNLKKFRFADFMTATKNFESDTLLGKEGFGKGAGVGVSIKKSNPESLQGFQEWQHTQEIEVPLCFTCSVAIEPKYTNEGKDMWFFSYWSSRSGWGMDYLHTSEKKAIYRDFKVSDILLDGPMMFVFL